MNIQNLNLSTPIHKKRMYLPNVLVLQITDNPLHNLSHQIFGQRRIVKKYNGFEFLKPLYLLMIKQIYYHNELHEIQKYK